jgi:DEAD/DEAH box helicase/Helicase conserved C-terminal domain
VASKPAREARALPNPGCSSPANPSRDGRRGQRPALQGDDVATSWRVIAGLQVGLVIPDLWQQEAVRALQQGKDVVVQAPTGSGKTYIFELLYPNLKNQAVFTVPTRALANDKLSEWRARGWDVGISTGDVALNLDAKVVVATLETQRGRFLRGEGPGLLVMDEFQMLGDPMRGVHYELAVALAPKTTQLLFLSGSVANPRDVVAWLQRIGRDAVLIEHKTRPVPLEETDLGNLPDSQFVQSRGPSRTGGSFWPRMIGRAMRADLAPVLVFAPRRAAAEQIAQAIASAVPVREPLRLTPAQEATAGKSLTKLLRNRVAYHHSGLSYAARAGVVESLAKAGQLNVVVATMGLAAGINFSMRSVIVTDRRYFAGNFERQVEADELLQMFGRAGRRGLDEVGHALYTNDLPRLSDTKARQLRRAAQVDWPSLISVMHAAKQRGDQPFAAAVELTHSLFSVQRVPLGVEHSLETGARPCGLWVTDERARFVRRGMIEMLNSREEWEAKPVAESVTLGRAFVREDNRWRRALTVPRMLDGVGTGNLCRLREQNGYGRELPIATVLASGEVALVKWLKKEITKKLARNAEPAFTELRGGRRSTPINREQAPNSDKSRAGTQLRNSSRAGSPMRRRALSREEFESEVRPLLTELVKPGVIVDWIMRGNLISVRLDYANVPVNAYIDSAGKALIDPPERENLPDVCRTCDQLEHDKTVAIVNSPTYAWRHLGLIEPDGTPTRRGMIFSFFHGGEGLAVAVALEDETYPIEELVFDLANIRAGPRFAGEDTPTGGRLGILCQQIYGRADYPGYLTMGVPVHYGAGASEVVRAVVADPRSKHKLTNELLRHGDIERALVEWRSILRHIVIAPAYPLPRWTELKAAAKELLDKTASPTSAVDLGTLVPLQQRAGGSDPPSFRSSATTTATGRGKHHHLWRNPSFDEL